MFEQGPDAAEQPLQQALEYRRSLFALAFKIRQLAQLGRHEELPAYCEELAAMPMIFPNKQDFFTGKIEAFAWADDLERIIETYQLALKEMGDEWDVSKPAYARSVHYVAVAHARLGNRETAIKLWKSIPRGMLEIATENLEDIQKPIGEQNGPWFFEIEHWVPKRFFTGIREEGIRAGIVKGMEQERQIALFEQKVVPFFKKAFTMFPSFEQMLIEMVKRGSADTRRWVRQFIGKKDTPELAAAVLEYAQGQSGSDSCRNEFIMKLTQHNYTKAGQTFKFWNEGEWTEIEPFNNEIYWEPREMDNPLSLRGQELVVKANVLVREGNYEEAIRILNAVNNREPGRPSVLHNIAMFYQALGNERMYNKLIDDVTKDFPDYFFGKISLGKRLIKQKQFDEAKSLLFPLQKQGRIHVSEFKALYGTLVLYHLAQGNKDVAQSIYDVAAQTLRDDAFPSFEAFQKEAEQY